MWGGGGAGRGGGGGGGGGRARRAARAGPPLGRAGDALPTARELEFRAAHAAARDAVHQPLDPDVVRTALAGHELLEVHSAAGDRATYLQRPDLGRQLAEGTSLPRAGADLAVVVADGLSPRAVHEHAAGLTTALLDRLPGWTVAPLVLAHQARVALGDAVGAVLGVRAVVVLIGERPGLSSADSLGVYVTWDPRPGRADSERNCVSNVRPPHGLSYAQAADTVAALLTAARELGASGVALKDEGPALPAGAG
ncbi:ethanolamine ammonia-lyase subunit EutC [Geodermatophilus sp. SYSU D00742]